MKRTTKLLMYFAAAAMTLASCGKEEIKPAEPETPGVIKVRFGAEAPITKAVATNDDSNFESTWVDGDEIGVTSYLSGSSTESNLEATWIDDAFYADFDGNKYISGQEYQFKGVYPYSNDGSVDFGAIREQTLGNQNGKYDIMVSSTISSVLPAQKNLVLPMERQTATVYFHLTSELNETVKSATLITEDGKWIAASSATLNHNGFSVTGDEKQIKLNILEDGANKMSTSDMKFWFNVLPVSETSLTLLVETETHSFTMSKKSKNTDWKAGHLYSTVINDIPEEKWAEIERPAGESTETIAMTYSSVSGSTYTPKTSYKTTDGIVTLTFAKADANNDVAWNNNSSELRLYANGTLTITAGEYKIKKIVYDAVINGGGKDKNVYPDPTSDVGVLDAENSIWTGNENTVVITPVGTVGNMGFKSITVTYEDPNASSDPIYKYSVVVNKDITNGTVTVDKTSAKEGDEVTIAATPAEGYELVAESVKAYNAVSGAELTVTNNKFTMPAANVNVTAEFSLIPTLSATSPEPYASNTTDNKGAGFSIPVTANQAWVAAIKADDPNDADITLMTAEGEGGENNNLVFKFNSQNTSPLVAKSTVVVLSPKEGNRPEPVEITITHDKRGATLVINNDDKANVKADVTAVETSYTANITNANFSEWSVLEYKIGDVAQPTTDANCVTVHDDGANTGSVTIKFPANASESNDVTITLKVGYEGIISRTLTLTQAAAAVRTPNVTLDFTDASKWGLPSSVTTVETTYSCDGYSIVLAGGGNGNGHKYSTDSSTKLDYLINGKSGATLTLPVFDFDVDKIKVYGHAGASTTVEQNIYVGETAVSTKTTGAAGTNTYEISSDHQSAGNVYVLKVSSASNSQISKIEIFGGAPKSVTSVEVSGTPTKTSYEAGEVFNPAGLTVTANYDDGSSKVVTTGITWTDGNGNELAGLTAGTTSVTVKAVYKNVPSTAFTVEGLTVTVPAPKTDLLPPSNLQWNAETKVLNWTDNNTDKGTYGINYKYQYSVGDEANYTDASSATSQTLAITSTQTVYVKAVAITTGTHNSSSSESKECTVVGGKTEQTIYTTGFETSEGYTTGNSYQGTVEQKDWKVYYGHFSTTGAVTGSVSLHMRLYSNKNAAYAITPTFTDATSITFNYQVSNKAVKFKVQVSTDGGNTWTDKTTVSPSGTTKTECSVPFGSTLSSAKVKILVTDGFPSSSNLTFRIDDVVVKGMR